MHAARPEYLVGLDLGPAREYSALAVVEAHEPVATEDWWEPRPRAERQLHLRHLQRWPRGASYAEVSADVSALLLVPALRGATLVLNQTGAGRPVVDMVRKMIRRAHLVRVTVTGGHATHFNAGGSYVPKTELVSVMQVLLRTRRLHFASGLQHAEVLVRELQNFRAKRPATTTAEMVDWRDGEDDDLVFAVALACWRVERRVRAGGIVL